MHLPFPYLLAFIIIDMNMFDNHTFSHIFYVKGMKHNTTHYNIDSEAIFN